MLSTNRLFLRISRNKYCYSKERKNCYAVVEVIIIILPLLAYAKHQIFQMLARFDGMNVPNLGYKEYLGNSVYVMENSILHLSSSDYYGN